MIFHHKGTKAQKTTFLQQAVLLRRSGSASRAFVAFFATWC